MKINRSELHAVLEKLQPGLAAKEIIEQSNKYIFQPKFIRTYNDEVAVTCPLATELEGVVPSEEFYNIIKKIPDEVILLESDDKEMVVRGRKKKYKIKIDTTIVLPNIKTNIKKWNTLPDDFSDAISFCAFSTSKDATDPTLTCLFISKNEVRSTDDKIRATIWTMQSEVKDEFLLPGEFIKAVLKYKPIKYSIEKSWLHFSNDDGSVFSCRTVDDEFPDISNYFKVKGSSITLPSDFAKIVDRSHILQKDEEKLINIALTKNKVTCVGEGEAGEGTEWESIEYDGPDISIYVNPLFLTQILLHLQKVTIGEKRLLFKGKNFEHVVCVAV